MVEFKSLVQGAKVVGLIVLAIVGVYGFAILGGIVIGVLVNVVTSGDINVSAAMQTALSGYEGTYISNITTALTALPTIAALVIVVVLILIFFGKRGLSFGGDKGGGIQ